MNSQTTETRAMPRVCPTCPRAVQIVGQLRAENQELRAEIQKLRAGLTEVRWPLAGFVRLTEDSKEIDLNDSGEIETNLVRDARRALEETQGLV